MGRHFIGGTPTLPLWATGKHVTAYVLTPQNMDLSTGNLTDASGNAVVTVDGSSVTMPWADVGSIVGHLEEIEIVQKVTTDDIPTSDSLHENPVPVSYGCTFMVTELEKSVGFNRLATLMNSGYNYYKVSITRGSQTWEGYALAVYLSVRTNKRGSRSTMHLRTIQIHSGATANPSYE